MSKRLYCPACLPGPLTKEDKARGFTERITFISLAEPPAGHGITMTEEHKAPVFTPMKDFHCDGCDEVITGSIAVAHTVNPSHRQEPADWENAYGRVMTKEEVDTYQKIAKA